jgi:hypothetical protein
MPISAQTEHAGKARNNSGDCVVLFEIFSGRDLDYETWYCAEA